MARLIAILAFVLGTVACGAEPQAPAVSTNKGVQVDVLTTFDGVTLYRVWDGSDRRVYVAVTGGNPQTSWSESCGKNCTREVEVTTVKR